MSGYIKKRINITELRGRKVEVYRNLHNGLYSVRDATTKRILGHASAVVLANVNFRVSQSGRLKVLESGQKNVHAWVSGELKSLAACTATNGIRVRYNPRMFPSFMADGKPIFKAAKVCLLPNFTIQVY